ncbi:HpcH/HpaI aldolase/citrate lyase family protein [Mesorhizobium captivum]|uniref:HpcH/HpaI aldolase/citrate lyase family protein n=1 Tax=Mesorhizobium captivum TaxID=3072319 RepID=UPI002A23DD8F|nr:aldolase/citrate lyase family protein [Mesorhizobium sp. VK22E]MDX8509269.1 aldolase/citrate lyase family protein [Mesorhizobium sp. VK22E]
MIKDTVPAVESAMSVPRWRSVLFVPAHVPRFVETAPERGADGVILDLEDSVPQDQKAESRRKLRESVAKVRRKGASVLVRVNRSLRAPWRSIWMQPWWQVLMHLFFLIRIRRSGYQRSRMPYWNLNERNLVQGRIRFLVQIETPRSFAKTHRHCLGSSQDACNGAWFSRLQCRCWRCAGIRPPVDAESFGSVCRPRGRLLPLGFIGSLGDFSDIYKLREAAAPARRLGFAGALAIHPTQVAIFNEAFSPSAQELE